MRPTPRNRLIRECLGDALGVASLFVLMGFVLYMPLPV